MAIRNSLMGRLTGAPILVVERESVARSSLSELSREASHAVFEAADSDAAIIKINNEAGLKVILLDLEMPAWRTVVSHARGIQPAAVILGMSTQDSSRTALPAQRLGVHGDVIKRWCLTRSAKQSCDSSPPDLCAEAPQMPSTLSAARCCSVMGRYNEISQAKSRSLFLSLCACATIPLRWLSVGG